eukprot:Lithocolla_globosa_v1_NODE_263_length_4756_cov_13.554137.p3 type:complete len:162 gc:universal NODE_263_length_4756_cov_13.554137:2451-2936(+)
MSSVCFFFFIFLFFILFFSPDFICVRMCQVFEWGFRGCLLKQLLVEMFSFSWRNRVETRYYVAGLGCSASGVGRVGAGPSVIGPSQPIHANLYSPSKQRRFPTAKVHNGHELVRHSFFEHRLQILSLQILHFCHYHYLQHLHEQQKKLQYLFLSLETRQLY